MLPARYDDDDDDEVLLCAQTIEIDHRHFFAHS